MGKWGVSPSIYSEKSLPFDQTDTSSSVWAGHRTATYRPNSHAWGNWVSPLICSEMSNNLGPTDMSSFARASHRTATYIPNSHAWLMGEVVSFPLHIVRRRPPWLYRQVILCVGRPSHSDLHDHLSCMDYGGSGVSPFIYSERLPSLGPTDMSSPVRAGSRKATYRPISHAWL